MDEILHRPRGGGHGALDTVSARLRLLGGELKAHTVLWREQAHRTLLQTDAATVGRGIMQPLHFFALAAVVGVAAVVSTVYMPAYVVSVDGVALGAVSEPSVFEDVVDRVEARATSILGYDYTLDSVVTYEKALVERGSLPSEAGFETYLFNQIGEVMKSYVLKVDGEFIGASRDKAELEAMLEELKAPYMTENTVEADFTSNVVITHEYTPSDVRQDLDEMEAILTENTSGQTVYEVQKGDTFMALAFANDMTMSELEALNPGIDINRLYIGQLLNIKEEIPFLSVQTVEEITYNEAIACPVEEVPDDSMYQGASRVLDAGVEGQALVTAQVTYVNGYERERNVIETQVLSEPTTKVVAVGTKVRPSWYPNGYFIWPVYGNITSYFGYRSIFGSYSYHGGIDIAASYGTNIKAADGGTVVWSGTGTGSYWSYGKYVVIDHGNGKQTYYAHCSSLLVSAGDKVYQGQPIARVGSTGRSTGNHCHFEVRIGGTAVNPLQYLS